MRFKSKIKQVSRRLASRCPYLFSHFKVWRSLVGGRWECWYVDYPIAAFLWHWIDDQTQRTQWYILEGTPSPLCRGFPEVEFYE